MAVPHAGEAGQPTHEQWQVVLAGHDCDEKEAVVRATQSSTPRRELPRVYGQLVFDHMLASEQDVCAALASPTADPLRLSPMQVRAFTKRLAAYRQAFDWFRRVRPDRPRDCRALASRAMGFIASAAVKGSVSWSPRNATVLCRVLANCARPPCFPPSHPGWGCTCAGGRNRGAQWTATAALQLWSHMGDVHRAAALVQRSVEAGVISDAIALVFAAAGNHVRMREVLAAIGRHGQTVVDARGEPRRPLLTPEIRAGMMQSPSLARAVVARHVEGERALVRMVGPALQVQGLVTGTNEVERIYNVFHGTCCEECRTIGRQLLWCEGCLKVQFCSRRCQKRAWNTRRHHCA